MVALGDICYMRVVYVCMRPPYWLCVMPMRGIETFRTNVAVFSDNRTQCMCVCFVFRMRYENSNCTRKAHGTCVNAACCVRRVLTAFIAIGPSADNVLRE